LRERVIRKAMGGSLRLLGEIAGSTWVDKAGLREPAERALREGARASVKAANALGRALQKNGGERRERGDDRAQEASFDLRPTDEQALMVDTAKRFAEEMLRPAAEGADEACAPPQEVLEAAHELGLTSFPIPEAFGGAGGARSAVTSVLLAEALSHGDMGLALAVLSPLSVAHALLDHGLDEQRQKHLPELAGEAFFPAAFALHEPRPLFDPQELRARAVPQKGGFTLTGEKTLVPLGRTARLFVVAAEVPGAGPRLFLVERGRRGLSTEPTPTMGLRSAGLCRLTLDRVELGRDALLGGEGPFDYEAAVNAARIGWAALALGAAQAALDHVVPYCNDRKAFGEPISHKQAVAFMVADMAIELEGTRLLTYRAASRLERGRDVRREAQWARIAAGEKGMKIGTDGVQLLGGHGYVKDHPVERFYRHLRSVAIVEGSLFV
jgi:alkylation response protein AidB-like acyl-CoA dehydrogenase